MKREQINRSRIIGLRLSATEYEQIEKKWRAGTYRKLSEYLRHCLLEKPVVTIYRNQSVYDLMAEMEKIKSELNRIGNNFNQMAKRLHTLRQIPELKSWLTTFDVTKETFFDQLEEIKKYIQKISEKWLQ